MIKTKNIVTRLSDIPDNFIFEYLLNLPERLDGSERWLTSIFNPGETRPSFSLFCKDGKRYNFCDFSSGKSGSAMDLAKLMYPEKKKGELIGELIAAYQQFLEGNPTEVENKLYNKYKVTAFELRNWDTNDARYWRQYYIGSKTLQFFNIAPLASFTMSKEVDGVLDSKKITRRLIYGYFRKDGSLVKCYQPENPACKFIKVRGNYLQGFDQLTFSVPNLLITKSLKDCAGFHMLGIPNWDVVSPDSENQMITKQQMNTLNFYKRKVVLFDSDKPGREAAEKYKETYGIPYVDLGMEKDITDSLKATSVEKVKSKLLKLLT